MQNVDIAALVQQLRALPAETTYFEFKESYNEPEKIGILVSAISNAACLEGQRFGFIVWGIRDKTHELVGTEFQYIGALCKGQPLEFYLAQNMQPDLILKFQETIVEDRKVVVLTIPASTGVSTKWKHIAYIRIDSATPKLSDYPAREAALISAMKPFSWERGVSIGLVSQDDVLRLLDWKKFYELLRVEIPASPQAVIGRLLSNNIIGRESDLGFSVSNLGAISLARNINNFESVLRKIVRVTFYEGHSRFKTLKSKDGGRGYAVGFDGLIAYLMENLPQEEEIVGGLRKTKHAYPELMLREAVANALVHQDFAISGAGPTIEVFKDRIEIVNPGRPLTDPERFIDMPPRSRNESLATVMKNLYICEERGSGVDKIVTLAEDNRLPAPDFRIDGENCKIILYGPRKFKDTSSTERVRACYQHCVLQYVAERKMTNSTLRARFGLDDSYNSQVSRIISEAVERRFIKQSDGWSARAGSYVPIWAPGVS